MSSDRQSPAFRRGDLAWFDFPHEDTAKHCPGRCTHEKLYGKPGEPKTVLLVMEGKNRLMLVLGELKPDGAQSPRRYKLLKCTSQEKYRNQPDYLPIPPYGYVHDVIHILTEDLASGRKDVIDVIDQLTLKQIVNWVGVNLGYRHPSQSTPRPSA